MRARGARADEFDTARSDLRASSLRGGVVTVGFQGVDALIRIGSLAILARVLTPEDFGLVSMVMVLTAIAEQFKDIGLSTATVQKKSISHEQLSTLFWINSATGVAIAALVCAAAVPLAHFFRDPRLVSITIALASGFVWSGVAIQHQALLRRRMGFVAMGAIQVGSTVISTGLATILAFAGYGYWALVWREVLRNVFIAIGTWMACPWTPGLARRSSSVADLLTFGGHLTAFNLVVFFTASVDQVLIGRAYGPALLGLYRQAHQLVVWPVMQLTVPVSRVAESTLSILQDAPDRYRNAFQRLVTAINLPIVPLLVFAAIYSHPIVAIVLGQQWIDAAPVFRVLALAMVIRPASDSTGLLLVTCGHTRAYLRLGIATGAIMLAAAGVGINWGATGVAYGILVATYAVLALRLRYGFRHTPVRPRLFLDAIETPLLASGVMAISLLAMNALLPSTSPFAVLALAVPVSVGTYALAWLLLPGGRHKLGMLVADLQISFRWERRAAPVETPFSNTAT